MRVPYNQLMEKLGTGHVLSPYETRPWFVYDDSQSLSCSAEVRVGPSAIDVEAEIQFLHDEPDARYASERDYGGPERIFLMRFTPNREGQWSPEFLLVKGEQLSQSLSNWEERGCEFFIHFIGALQMDEIPDVDEMIENLLTDDSRGGRGGRRGRVGKKGFKVEQKPMSMKM